MKIHYRDLLRHLSESPSKKELSDKLFQLGHEHEINKEVFEMEFTPNRGDCLSLNGLSRDLNVFFKNSKQKEIFLDEIDELDIDFVNRSPKDCPKISFLEIEVKEIKKTYMPYLEDYFKNLENKKVNFFTDISNYLSYEAGQPTHCYDSNKLKNKLIFEKKEIEEDFRTLLDTKISLQGENCVFSSGKEIINLAGVMGGLSTCCDKKTKKALVECAYFRPESIIGKSVKYNLLSDASYKFERGVDISAQIQTLRRFIKIVSEHAEISSLKIRSFDYQRIEKEPLGIDCNLINNILGTDISKERYLYFLDKLGFKITNKIHVPSFRHDIANQNDLAEEIARIIGYDSIESKELIIEHESIDHSLKKTDLLRSFFTMEGFTEVINFPFSNEKSEFSIQIDNPLDANKSKMRTELKNSLLGNLIFNERRQKESIKLFEVSDIYENKDNSIKKIKKVGIIATGRQGENPRDFSKFISKDYLNNLLKGCLDNKIDFMEIKRDQTNTKKTSKIFYFEFDLDDANLKQDYEYNKKSINFINYKKISEYPSSSRDFSFLLKDLSNLNKLLDQLEKSNDKHLKKSFMFDFYNNESKGEVKIGYRFIFQSQSRTLKEEDINSSVASILDPILKINGVSVPGM